MRTYAPIFYLPKKNSNLYKVFDRNRIFQPLINLKQEWECNSVPQILTANHIYFKVVQMRGVQNKSCEIKKSYQVARLPLT